MVAAREEPAGPERAHKRPITDVFDDEKRTVLVKYPPNLIARLTTFGILTLVITGLVGYPRTETFSQQTTLPDAAVYLLDIFFGKPWLFFLFFSSLILTLEWSVLRASALQRYRRSAYVTTVISMVIVSVLYIFRDPIGRLLNNLLSALQPMLGHLVSVLKDAPTNPWTWLVINLALLGVIFGQAVPGWRRRALQNPAHVPIDLQTGQPVPVAADEQPTSVWDLVAGDLIVRQAFTLGLALLFWFPVISRLVGGFGGFPIEVGNPDPAHAHVFSICSVSLPNTCFVGFSFELWALDILVATFALAIGLVVLGFRVQADFMAQPNTHRGQEMLNAVVDIVLSPFNRSPRSRIGSRIHISLQTSLSPLLWRPLVFAGVVGAAGLADFTKRAIQCPRFYDPQPVGYIAKQCTFHSLDNSALSYVVNVALPIAGFGLLAIAGSVLALAAMFERGHIASNTLRFLRWVAGSNALPVGLFLGALALANFGALLLAHLIDLVQHHGNTTSAGWQSWFGLDTQPRFHPFYPGLLTLVLAGALFVYFGGVLPVRAWIRRRK
jgi:hypothetical protein